MISTAQGTLAIVFCQREEKRGGGESVWETFLFTHREDSIAETLHFFPLSLPYLLGEEQRHQGQHRGGRKLAGNSPG